MGKKTDAREDREILQVRIFQWEFLRRNPDYKSDYAALIRKFGAWFEQKGYWYERNKPYMPADYVYAVNHIYPVLREICRKWEIADPFPPDWKFDSLGFYEYAPGWEFGPGWRESVPTGETAESAAFLWDYPQIELVEVKGALPPFGSRYRSVSKRAPARKREQRRENPTYIHLTLDATQSTRVLLKQARKRIELHREKYSEIIAGLSPKRKVRRRLDQYPLYLKTWDLRSEGNTFAEIAQKMYPREYAAFPRRRNPWVQRVMDYYTRARELIMGGYKELR